MTSPSTRHETMHAVRWYGARDLKYEEVPVPRPGPSEVLIAVERVGLCGSDLEEYREGPVAIPPEAVPIILGHEVVGTVVQSPSGDPAVGTRVVPDVVVGCGHCWWCRRHEEGLCPELRVRGQQQDGGLAEYMIAEAATCITVPSTVDVNTAAFAEPTAVAVRAIRKAGDLSGLTVAVIGGGTIGNLIGQIALASACQNVITVDPHVDRRHLAAQFGSITTDINTAADVTFSHTGGRGADVVFECAGVRTAPGDAVRLSRRGGTIVLVGFRPGTLQLPWLDIVLQERHLVGSAAHLWDEDVAAAVAMLTRGIVNPTALHSGTVPLIHAMHAFEQLDTDTTITKLLITPAGDGQ